MHGFALISRSSGHPSKRILMNGVFLGLVVRIPACQTDSACSQVAGVRFPEGETFFFSNLFLYYLFFSFFGTLFFLSLIPSSLSLSKFSISLYSVGSVDGGVLGRPAGRSMSMHPTLLAGV